MVGFTAGTLSKVVEPLNDKMKTFIKYIIRVLLEIAFGREVLAHG